MKWIFAILLVANLLFFVVMQAGSGTARDTLRGHEPVKADQVKLLPEPVKQPVLALTMSEATSKSTVPPNAAEAKPEVCLEWGQFSGDALNRATLALDKLQLGDKLVARKAEKTGGYWVYVAPRKTLPEAHKKVDELKQLGVAESFIIRDAGKMQYAISLGIFSTEEAATKFLEQLREKGVKSAVSGPRTQEIDATVFQVRDGSDAMSAQLAKLKLDFPGSELKAVECRKPAGEGQ